MNRQISVIFIVIALLCSACAGNNEYKKKLEEEFLPFKAKTITLPENMLVENCVEQGIADTTLLCRPLKMVVYVNQEGCQDCNLRTLLPVYMFMLENQHLENFGVIIILNTFDMEAAAFTLSDMRFNRTVFFDLDGSFERLNPHLPAGEQFHTFLLNKENKVVLVGNPVHNEKLKSLYLSEMNK